jgi:hypothetical protein
VDNAPSLHLYHKFGFQSVADRLPVMVKSL